MSFSNTLQKTLDQGAAEVVERAHCYQNNPDASQAGFVAEADHCATFNARKALERDGTRAVLQPNGTHGDYQIVKGEKVLVKGEMKYYSTAEKTQNAMRGYDDQQLVGPSDQVDDIKVIAGRKAGKNGASDDPTRQRVGKEHEAVAENVSDSISDGKTRSTPRTREEAKKIAKDAEQGKISPESTMPSLGESLKISVTSGAKSGAKSGAVGGAVFGGGVSALINAKAWVEGDKDGADALVDTAVDVGKSTVDGAVKGVAGTAATVAAKHAATRVASPLLKTVLRGSGPAAIAIGAVEMGKHTVDLVRGEIDGDEFVEEAVKTVATGGGAWGGAALGMTFGGPVGAVVGGFLGAIGVGSLFD